MKGSISRGYYTPHAQVALLFIAHALRHALLPLVRYYIAVARLKGELDRVVWIVYVEQEQCLFPDYQTDLKLTINRENISDVM